MICKMSKMIFSIILLGLLCNAASAAQSYIFYTNAAGDIYLKEKEKFVLIHSVVSIPVLIKPENKYLKMIQKQDGTWQTLSISETEWNNAQLSPAQNIQLPASVITIGPANRTQTNSFDITLATSLPYAELRYTLDGTDVTNTSPLYVDPITRTIDTTVKARTFYKGIANSEQAVVNYVIQKNTVDAPEIFQNGDSYNNSVNVCIRTATYGAELRYSTDGSNVTSSSSLYKACFTVPSSATVKAKGFKAGMTDSPQSSAVFTDPPLKGPLTRYGYDARGRLIHIDDDKGVSATYALDTAGNRMVVQDQTAPPLSPEITMLIPNPDKVTEPTEVTISWKAKNTSACSMRLNRGNGEPEVISGGSSGSIKAIISSQTGVILTCVYRGQSKSLSSIIKGPRQ